MASRTTDAITTAHDQKFLLNAFTLAALIGLLGLWTFAISAAPDARESLWMCGAGLLIAGSHAFVGALLGFLFAIPRSRQQETAPPPAPPAGGASQTPNGASDYSANTNLEQISDWLTKILIGASLTQLQTIRAEVAHLATVLAPALGGTPAAKPVALCLMGFFVLWGFFFAYLLTRLWLPKALTRAESQEQLEKSDVQQKLQDPERSALEGRAYRYLFLPNGFARAIEEIEHYQESRNSSPSALLWMYLACAYGQKHAELKRKAGLQSPESDEARDARRKAVGSTRKALDLNPGLKDILRGVYEGASPGDDDLKSLNPDEELEALLRDKK